MLLGLLFGIAVTAIYYRFWGPGGPGYRYLLSLRDLRRNLEVSPWAKSQGPEGWLRHIEYETRELKVELEGIRCGRTAAPLQATQEWGDVFFNLLSLGLALEKVTGIPMDRYLEGALDKLHARKWWVFSSEKENIPATPEAEQLMVDMEKSKLALLKDYTTYISTLSQALEHWEAFTITEQRSVSEKLFELVDQRNAVVKWINGSDISTPQKARRYRVWTATIVGLDRRLMLFSTPAMEKMTVDFLALDLEPVKL